MTPAPIDPHLLLQRDYERAKSRTCDSEARVRATRSQLRTALAELAELRRVHLGDLRYGEP